MVGCTERLASPLALGGPSVACLLPSLPHLRLPHARRLPLHRLRQPRRPRRRTPALRVVRPNARPLGRNHFAVAGPAAAGRLFLPRTPARGLRVLPVFLL